MSKKEIKLEELPKLPHGQGSFHYYSNNTKIQYKKNIELSDGTKVYKSVTGLSVKECMKKMNELQKQLQNSVVNNSKKNLNDALNDWLSSVKRGQLKATSYIRLKSTIKNQIEPSEIGHSRYQDIRTEELQNFITYLNEEKHYSHSVIKKTFDCLNEFYRYKAIIDKFDNPMLLVEMPSRNNIIKAEKEIEFFEQDDIERFIDEASKKCQNKITQKYKYGYVLASNIYLGMRIGELLALTWQDIDFDNNTIFICKTLIENENEMYNEALLEDMKENGIKRNVFQVQYSTKRSKNRYIPINKNAKKLLLKHKEVSIYTNSNDFVISTSNRKTSTTKNIKDMLNLIEKNAGTEVQNSGTHVLRHTCASLYFRKHVPIEIICQILGNTREVCEKTYLHFVEEQLKTAASNIEVIDI